MFSKVFFAVFIAFAFAACASTRGSKEAPDPDAFVFDFRNLDEIEAAIEYVDNCVYSDEADDEPIDWDVEFPDRLTMETMSPIQLLIVASHFYDKRPSLIVGCYENGPDCDGLWTVGNRMFHYFQWIFFVYNYEIIVGAPDYLQSREAALRWMLSHKYDVESMRAEYERDIAK